MDKIEIVITRGCDAEGDGGTVVENAARAILWTKVNSTFAVVASGY